MNFFQFLKSFLIFSFIYLIGYPSVINSKIKSDIEKYKYIEGEYFCRYTSVEIFMDVPKTSEIFVGESPWGLKLINTKRVKSKIMFVIDDPKAQPLRTTGLKESNWMEVVNVAGSKGWVPIDYIYKDEPLFINKGILSNARLALDLDDQKANEANEIIVSLDRNNLKIFLQYFFKTSTLTNSGLIDIFKQSPYGIEVLNILRNDKEPIVRYKATEMLSFFINDKLSKIRIFSELLSDKDARVRNNARLRIESL